MNTDKAVICRVCKKEVVCPGFFGHIKRWHPAQFDYWIRSRSDFGISIFEHLEVRRVSLAVIRQ